MIAKTCFELKKKIKIRISSSRCIVCHLETSQTRKILISASGLFGGVFLLLSWVVLKGTWGIQGPSPLPSDTSALQILPQSTTKHPALWSSTDLISRSDPLFSLKQICNNVGIYGLVRQSLICFSQN